MEDPNLGMVILIILYTIIAVQMCCFWGDW